MKFTMMHKSYFDFTKEQADIIDDKSEIYEEK